MYLSKLIINVYLVLRPNLIRDPGFESLFMIWDWFESFFQDSDPGFANDSQDFAKILRGFVEKWKKILTFGNLKCQVLLKNARFLLKDSQKSQNWKIDSDLPLIRIPKLKIRWRLESLKLGFGLNTKRDSALLLRRNERRCNLATSKIYSAVKI